MIQVGMVVWLMGLLFLREMAFVAVGLAMIHMAYQLFLAGVINGGADELTVGTWIKVKGGGPGIAFACLGAGIVVYTIATTGRLELKEIVELEQAYQLEQRSQHGCINCEGSPEEVP